MPDVKGALYQAGLAVRRKILGDAWVDKSLAARTPFTTDFQDMITRNVWNEIWNRPGLDHKTRRLLVVDEPTKGLAPAVIQVLIDAFQRLKQSETTILLVEQNFHLAVSIGDDVAVMDDGRIVHTGSMAGLAADEALQHRLLGLSLAVHQ